MEISHKLSPKSIFDVDDIIGDDVTPWRQIWPCSCLNEIGTFSANQVEVFKQSVPNLVNLRSSVLQRSL